jgi:hypothetical protein
MRLLEEIMGTQAVTPQIMMDNMSAIALGKNPVLHGRSKNIKTKYHFNRECVDRGEVELELVGTVDQLADILTKPLKSAFPRITWKDQRDQAHQQLNQEEIIS